MYSGKKIYKNLESPHPCFFKEGDVKIIKNQEYSNFLCTYCGADYSIDISDRRSVTSEFHLFNGTLIDWCVKKNSETSIMSSNV